MEDISPLPAQTKQFRPKFKELLFGIPQLAMRTNVPRPKKVKLFQNEC